MPPESAPTTTTKHWAVLVDFYNEVVQDDVVYRVASREEAQTLISGWLRAGTVSHDHILPGRAPSEETDIVSTLYPLAGVKRFEIRYLG